MDVDANTLTLISACTALAASMAARKVERIMLVKNKIRLLINPGDKDQRALLAAVETPFARLWQQEEHDVVAEITADIEEITKHTQVILRREWLRVKRGE